MTVWCVVIGLRKEKKVFVPFRGARLKGLGYDGTSWELMFRGRIVRDEGWKE